MKSFFVRKMAFGVRVRIFLGTNLSVEWARGLCQVNAFPTTYLHQWFSQIKWFSHRKTCKKTESCCILPVNSSLETEVGNMQTLRCVFSFFKSASKNILTR